MAKCKSLLCPFEGAPEYCPRHSEKGIPKETKKYTMPKVSAKKKADTSEKERKKRLTEFYNECLNRMPHICMESGEPLFSSTVINPRTVCVHILEKSKFHSVDCNFDNIIYMTAHNHNRYDMQRERFMNESKIAPLIRERVAVLYPFLTQEEKKRVPEYLLTK